MEGIHVQDGREFKKGEIVVTEQDLTTMFTGKFVEMRPEDPPVAQRSSTTPLAPAAAAVPHTAAARPKRKKALAAWGG